LKSIHEEKKNCVGGTTIARVLHHHHWLLLEKERGVGKAYSAPGHRNLSLE
jgi:hypothetical protein